MITREEIIKEGFKELGHEDNDIFYKLSLAAPRFSGIRDLTGNLEDGFFTLYDNKEVYNNIKDLKKVVKFVSNEK